MTQPEDAQIGVAPNPITAAGGGVWIANNHQLFKFVVRRSIYRPLGPTVEVEHYFC
jgi:hypothetical protein